MNLCWPCHQFSQMAENKLQVTVPNLQASFALLNKYRNQTKRLRNAKEVEQSKLKHLQMEKRNEAFSEVGKALNSQAISAVNIMRMMEMVLSLPTVLKSGDFSNIVRSFGFESGISSRSEKHLKQVLKLLDAAEMFSSEEYGKAEELLVSVLSSGANPIERVINCYAQYLREKIDIKKCRVDLEREAEHADLEDAVIDLRAAMFACEQKLPLIQISNFAAIQTILDSLASAERIHVFDIGRKICSYCMVMMHALSNRENLQVKQLKITAVCSPIYDCKETGKLQSSFAESVKLPFEYKILNAEENELDKVHLEFEDGETVAVFMDHSLHCLSGSPKNIENLLIRLKSLNPHIMVVTDVEENFSTGTFIERFRGALSLSSAILDCLESCLEGDRHCINTIQKLHFQMTICKGVLSDDEDEDEDDSFSHHRRVDSWRGKFMKFGIIETELSERSVSQAHLMIGAFPVWSSCSLSMNGKSMIVSWKGIPLRFVSAWKFQQDCVS